MDRLEIGKRIKKLRESKNITKYRLAADAGVSPSYISALERGKKCPTVETLDSICFALQITLVDFLSKKDNYFDKLSALSPRQKTLLNDFLESL